MESANKRVFRNALFVMVVVAALWWFLADRPSPLSGSELPARVLRDYIDAARRRDCAAVVAALSARSRELAVAAVAGRSTLERSFCDYSPATAKWPHSLCVRRPAARPVVLWLDERDKVGRTNLIDGRRPPLH